MSNLRTDNESNRLVEGLAQGCGSDLVRFIARRLRSVSDARDVAHEAYVRLLRVKRKDLIRDPQAYLYRIAINILYEFELQKKADAVGLARCAECQATESDFGHIYCVWYGLSLLGFMLGPSAVGALSTASGGYHLPFVGLCFLSGAVFVLGLILVSGSRAERESS